MEIRATEWAIEVGGQQVASCASGKMSLWSVTLEQFRAIKPYLSTWEVCGRFVEKPLEWVEAVPGVVWACGAWWIRTCDAGQFHVWKNTSYLCSYGSLEDAKLYAEGLIRAERRSVAGSEGGDVVGLSTVVRFRDGAGQ